ncbi:MAG: DUF4124 domain-containing protein [Aromatoleum sp.]|nr:DUF4124 domain-containing protein [Aromatoleum sp.]
MTRRTPALTREPLPAAFILALGLLVTAAPALGALYKWTDANGRVVYSDQPPPPSIKSEILNTAPPSANPNAVKENALKDVELRQRQLLRTEQDKKTEKEGADAAKKAELCTQARGQLKTYESETPIYRFNQNGERILVDDAARAKEIERLQVLLRERCPA